MDEVEQATANPGEKRRLRDDCDHNEHLMVDRQGDVVCLCCHRVWVAQ